MRIRKINITRWRNFENVSIEVPEDAPLICLVGANGTGKTHILELISATAHHFGLSAGIQIPRGDPFQDSDHEFLVEIFLANNASEAMDAALREDALYESWDRTLSVKSRKSEGGHVIELSAGGIADAAQAQGFAAQIVARLRQSKEVHHLTLDSDRAYPRKNLPAHEMAQAFEIKWWDENYTKGRSFFPTGTLYDEWIKYCLARENKAANLYYQGARRAAETGDQGPQFADAFGTYRASLREVMSHLLFAGADQERKTILFDTSGMELRFDQLSGGEREVAFLVGQIDRFGLKKGLFLLDEPELHLNPDLVRSWVTYLAKTVETGQVWLATHSLEAVEAAGENATILLERNEETRKVDKTSTIADSPLFSALSRAVGTPAFSISALRFVFIEGEEAIGERERYRRVCGLADDTRFIECGSCNEVARRVVVIRSLSSEVRQPIRVTGVVDRDWRSKAEADRVADEFGVFVLPVHEVENLFLHTETVQELARRNGKEDFDFASVLRNACDRRAGGWIIQGALFDAALDGPRDISAESRALAHGMSWSNIGRDIDGAVRVIVERSGVEAGKEMPLFDRLVAFAHIYERKRNEGDLWKVCEGKEIVRAVAQDVGFANAHTFEQAATTLWAAAEERLPPEVLELRKYLAAI